MQRFPLGVVAQDGDGYVGTCDEVGTTSFGRTVEEAFANLRVATWQHLERQHRAARSGDARWSNERQAT
jgi:predicted RNase H-like HicB family nuclease